MNRVFSALLLTSYRAAVGSGILRKPWAQRLFLSGYGHYKALLEARDADRLAVWVPSAGVVFDVGANVGFFTLKFARWVGPQGRVVALEPEPVNVEHLCMALARTALAEQVSVVPAAAADRVGAAHLELNPFHPGDHKLASAGVPVALTTIDAQVQALALTRVDLVKIDVQGAEQLVLAGARATIARWRPVLYIEVDDLKLRRYDSSAQQLLSALCALGYSAHRLDGSTVSPSLSVDGACAWVAKRGYVDLLFLPLMEAPRL